MVTTAQGKAHSRSGFNFSAWKPALRTAGIPHTRENMMHVLRHSFASALIAPGVDARRVAACLGHDDPSFTLRVHGHLLPDAEDSAAGAQDRADVDGSDEAHAGERPR